MKIAVQMQYTGKAETILNLLDSIILQNDKIENAQFKRNCLLNDGSGSHDDMGLSERIKEYEQHQQKTADEIARIDKRGTIRARITTDSIRFLSRTTPSDEAHDQIKNYLITLALLAMYRMRVKQQSALINGMLGFLPTTGRDYSVFRKSWMTVYGNPNQHVRES